MPSAPSGPAVLLRLLVGAGFGLAGFAWLFHTAATVERALLTVGERSITRLDVAALPLLVTGCLLVLLATFARRAGPATAATVWLVVSGVLGALGAWWLSIDPLGEGEVLASVDATHGFTQSDLLVLPVLAVAAGCGVAGAVAFVRSLQTRPAVADHARQRPLRP